MTTYRYKGMTSSGASVEGVVEAFDKNDGAYGNRTTVTGNP